MKTEQIAAQLYTLRDYMKTPEEIMASLKKVKAIGFQSVQASDIGPIKDDELAKILRGEGLVCCATHESGTKILTEPKSVVEKLQILNCRYTAYPCPDRDIRLDDIEDIKSLAKRLNAAGKILHDAGLALAYHNHAIEFRRFAGRTMLEILFAETDPAYLQAEIDTYWVQYGGGDPVDWCRRLKGRLPLLHLKDYMVKADHTPTFAEIGNGNLNWKAIIRAAEESGCRWFIIEQDTCSGDPFESLKASLEYLKENFCR